MKFFLVASSLGFEQTHQPLISLLYPLFGSYLKERYTTLPTLGGGWQEKTDAFTRADLTWGL